MIKQIFLKLLTAYRARELSQEVFEKKLDELYLSATEQIKDKLEISVIFVSLALSRLRAAPSERYNDEEMDQLIEQKSFPTVTKATFSPESKRQ